MSKIDLDMEELRRMAWASTVPLDGDEEAQIRSRLTWIARSTPEDWHRFAQGFNWGDGIEPLFRIVRHEQCDLATALHVFWHSEPGWDLMLMAQGERVYPREEAPMIAYIAERVAAGGYTRRKIAWDPTPELKADYDEMKANLARIANPPFPLHPDLVRPVRGREVVDSAEAWAERPAGVRNGFWLNLPPSGIVTPVMVQARDLMRNIFFNLFAMGAVTLAARAYFNDVGTFWMMILGCVAAIVFWGWWINQASMTVRGYLRSELIPVPQRQMMLVYGALTLSGMAWMQGYFALSDLVAADGDGSGGTRMAQAAVCAAWLVPFWFGLRWAAQHYTYRWLFRQ